MEEEFVKEEKIFSRLVRKNVVITKIDTQISYAVTDRPGQEGVLTRRYFEIFNAKFIPELDYLIYLNLQDKDTNLYLASKHEILNEETNKGIKISKVCKLLFKIKR